MSTITESTDDFLILGCVTIEKHIAKKEQELKKELADKVARAEAFRAELMKRLIERGAQNTKTESGTAYISEHLNITVVNRDALLAYAQEHWENGGGALVVIKPPVDAIRDHIAMHGSEPPGVTTKTFPRLNIRGAN